MSTAATRPATTPTEVTTSVMIWRPSATSAGERSVAAGADQERRPDEVDDGRDAVDREAGPGLVEAGGRRPVRQTSTRISSAATHDQHAFQHRREIFGLVVAERVILVGRLVADADRPEGRQRGDHVDDRFQRVGIERHRAGQPPCEQLQAEHDEGNDDRPEGEPRDLLLGRRRGRDGCQIRPPSPSPCAANGRRCSRSCACRRSGRAS